jgi:hypothetical protein
MTVGELFSLAEERGRKLTEVGEAKLREADALRIYRKCRAAGDIGRRPWRSEFTQPRTILLIFQYEA